MTINVVDGFETIQVDNADGEAGSIGFGPRIRVIKVGKKCTTVGQTRQAIDICKPEIFRACTHHAGKVTIVDQQYGKHGRGDKGRVDGDCDKDQVPGQGKENDKRAVNDESNRESGRAQVHQAENYTYNGDRHIKGYMSLFVGAAVGK